MKCPLVCLLVAAVCACDGSPPNAPADAPTDAQPDAAPDANRAPIADAGPDATYLIGGPFDLDGSASTDPDGSLVSYQWTVESRPAGSIATVANELDVVASFTPDEHGTYSFALLVTDDGGMTARDTVTVIVEPGELTVDAGPDQTVVWHDTIQLSGSYVSQTGPVTATWRFLSRPVTAQLTPLPVTSLTPTFFAQAVGTYVAELEVTSPAGTATDTVTITAVAPPPELIAGDIVDVEPGWSTGRFVIASLNPPRLRLLSMYWPTPVTESVIPLTVTPTAIGVSETGTWVSVIHDSTQITFASTESLSQQVTMDLETPLLDVRHGSATPRVYPAQAGPLLLVNQFNSTVYPGGLTPGPSRGREVSSSSRPLYAIDIGASAKLRRYDGHSEDTTWVREWPYAGGQYPLGDDLWIIGDASIVVSTGHVFNISDDPLVDMTHRGFLDGAQPFAIAHATRHYDHIVTLHNRITTPPELPESQVRFYNKTTLALEYVVPVPDLVVDGVPQRTLGHSVTVTSTPGRVYVVGTAGTTSALFTIPVPVAQTP